MRQAAGAAKSHWQVDTRSPPVEAVAAEEVEEEEEGVRDLLMQRQGVQVEVVEVEVEKIVRNTHHLNSR
jgi:hypothetical protein